MASKSKLGDLDITQDELKRLENALKDENFRKLFCEYAEEISDPENRRRYEEEIAQMERERGMDVTFVRPEPGYVLKTSVNGEQKAFINISKSDKIDKPFSEKKQNNDGKIGLMWHIPHSFAPPREDHDKHKKVCQVYDFVIHPDTYRMAESNVRFKILVEDTAMDGVEKQFQVKLDRKNIKRPQMQFKGTPTATVIRSRNASGHQQGPDAGGMLKDMPYPYDNKSTLEKMKEREQRQSKEQENKRGHESSKTKESKEVKKDDATIPKYTIVHRSQMDMQEYRNAPDAKPSTRPGELVIKIELPLLKSAAQADLDIFEKRLTLESSPPAAYKLDLTLPYLVDDSKGSAKFDKQKRTLIVTLPVVPDNSPSVPSFINDGAENEQETNGISVDSSHKGNVSAERPLIEVLSNGTDSSHDDLGAEGTQQDTAKPENGETFSTNVSNGEGGNHFTAAVSYSLPEFSFTQDTETVSFVLKVKNVAENSIKQKSPSDHEIDFICTSQGEGGFPLHFRLFLHFAENCRVVPEHCTVDVTAENVVLLLLKERGSRGLWDQFWTGLDSDNLEKHLFLTTSNLQQQLQELDESSTEMGQMSMPGSSGDAPAQDSANCSLEVTAMNEKKLTIKIIPPGKTRSTKRKEEEEEYDPPSSAEIEVVHSRPNPLLHGILKQHSISESSEEVGHDHDSAHSSNEENDDDDLSPPVSSPGKRHTVSFSEHIDKATYKSSASVNSMKTALKSKRKRQRKWEEKQDKNSSRRRHNSAGSEGSSDDPTHSVSDSHSISEKEAREEKKSSDQQQDTEASAKKVLDFRTNPCESLDNDNLGKETNPNSGMENHENINGSEHLGETEGAEVTSLDDKGSNITNTRPVPTTTEGSSGEETSTGSSRKGGSIADKIKSKLAEENTTEDPVEDSDDEGEDCGDEGTKSPGTSQLGQGSSSKMANTFNEHRTECAFQFSNEVMFDLDVE